METATKLSAEEQKELAEARARVQEAESKAAEHLDEYSRVSARYSELVSQVEAWRKDLDRRLSKLREDYLAGKAKFDDWIDILRDIHALELAEADLDRKHETGMTEWERLVAKPQARAVATNTKVQHTRSVIERLERKAEGRK